MKETKEERKEEKKKNISQKFACWGDGSITKMLAV